MAQLDTNGITLHRSGSGPPLMLLHCLGVDHRFWDFAAPLARDFTLLRYDLPGHGGTPVPSAPFLIEDLSTQLAAVLREQRIPRVSIAGISLGGLIAQHFAANHAELVDRVVLVDTTPRYTDEMRAMWGTRAATARTEGVGALVDDLLKIWFSSACLAQDSECVRYVRERLRTTSGEGYALSCEALAKADLRSDAARINKPTLVVCGDDDIPSFLDAARWLSESISGARIAWLAGARHASVLEHPARTISMLSDFLH
jgi:3-oxoadipate enol-lactonase